MKFEVRSPVHDQESILIPAEVDHLSKPFNGTICSRKGDEYTIENNIVDLLPKEREYTLAQSTNNWAITASVYEDLWRVRSLSLLTGEPFPIDKEKELLNQWVNPQPGKTYLDVGCSTEARMKAEANQTDILLIRTDARDMPFFAKTFDGLAMGGTLNELGDELKVLFECRRVLKDDGTMFMMHLIKSDTWYGWIFQNSAEWSGLKFWTIDESNVMFERAGFSVIDQFAKGIVCFTKLIPA